MELVSVELKFSDIDSMHPKYICKYTHAGHLRIISNGHAVTSYKLCTA